MEDTMLNPENRARGFYILMTNCITYSDRLNEFVISDESVLKLLDKARVDYTVLE